MTFRHRAAMLGVLAIALPAEAQDAEGVEFLAFHSGRCDGLTVAASEGRHVTQIARRTVISDDALSVLIPVLEEIGGCTQAQIRRLFEQHGVLIQEWDRVRTDRLTILGRTEPAAVEPAAVIEPAA